MTDFTWSRSEVKRYESEIFSILQSFEKAQEWADLSNCLQRLHRCISKEFVNISGVPLKETISKRLAQCLNPSFPSGVHIKALETYACIFEKIGRNELSSDLALYGSGLFPFFVHSSTQVKPIFLDLIEKYFLPLGPCLLPCLSGLLVGLLPGLEDSKNECYERLMKTFQLISNDNCVGEKNFMCTLWLILLRTTQVRYSALEVIMARFPTNNSREKKVNNIKIKNLIPCNNLFTKALESCFEDENILVKRHLLDFLIAHVPLEKNKLDLIYEDLDEIITFESKITLLRKALRLFLLREWSLTRRLIQWIINNKNVSPINKSELKMEESIKNILITAIIEEFSYSYSIIENYSSSEVERSIKLVRTYSNKLSKLNSNLHVSQPIFASINLSTYILQTLKIISILFEECNYCIEFIMPKILIPLLIFSDKCIKKVPEFEASIINECKYILNISNLKYTQFLDSIGFAFNSIVNNSTYNKIHVNSFGILNPTIFLLEDILFFYINHVIEQDSFNYDVLFGDFLIDLLNFTMTMMIKCELNNDNMIVLINISLYSIKKLEKIENKDQMVFHENFHTTIKNFMKITSDYIYDKQLFSNKFSIRKLFYSLLLSFYNTEALRNIILNESEKVSLAPFDDFPIPKWLFNIYTYCTNLEITSKLKEQMDNNLIEDLFDCLKLTIEILFNSKFLISDNCLISNCWTHCIKNIIKLLWELLDPFYYKFHKETTFLLIKLENWVRKHFSIISKERKFLEEYQIALFKGDSLLTQLFITQLSLYNSELKILNIKKLSSFIKYSINTDYRISSEVTFLVLEGLDSNLIQLKSMSSLWVIQAFESSNIILDHIIEELINPEIVSYEFKFNEVDFERLIYTLDRLVAVISLENINVIQLMIDKKINKLNVPILSKYNVENYFDAFIYIILNFLNIQTNDLQDLRVQSSAANTLNNVLKKSSLNNALISLKKSTYYQDKIANTTLLIADSILETLQFSISRKQIQLQILIVQILHTILYLQRSYKNPNINTCEYKTLINNNKLFPVIISGLQQIPLTSSDVFSNETLLYSNNFLHYSLPIKSYIDFCLSIFEELSPDLLVQNTTSVIISLCLESIASIKADNHTAIIQYFDSILRILLHIIGLPSTSNSLFSSKINIQNNSGFINSFFNWQKEYTTENQPKIYFEISSINSLPSMLNIPVESGIDNIKLESKISIIKNTILTLFSTLVETLYYIQKKEISSDNLNISQIIEYINSISFLLAWNASDAFIFSGIACWSYNNSRSIKMKLNKKSVSYSDSRNIAIISIFQFDSILKFINPVHIFFIIGDFLSYYWFYNNSVNFDSFSQFNDHHEDNKSIPSYIIYFSKIHIEKEWISCSYLWSESFVYHFLYTILVTFSFTKPEEFFLLWNISSSLLNTFLQKVKQPKCVLWFATLLSTLDVCMASCKSLSSSFFQDKKILNIFSDKKLIKNLNSLIHMIMFLVHKNFSVKVTESSQPQQYDKFPPLPPTIEAMLQSIEFNVLTNEKSTTESQYNEYPKAIISDDPTLLFSYYSMSFLIMYNIEILCHSNNKRLFLKNIWCNSIIKSLDWAFQPLLKRNNEVSSMIHKYFILLYMDTFPFKMFPEYLSGIKKSVIDSINSPDFFCIDRRTFRCWINVISRLVINDISSNSSAPRTSIIDTYTPIQSMGIFSTRDAELQNRCSHIKRLAFLIFSCPQNAFQPQLSIILEKLVENLKLSPEYLINTENINPYFISLAEQVILCLRVLLLKIHYQALMPLWPIVLAELIKIFRSSKNQKLIISAMKFVDLASLLDIPEFHLYQWIFVTDFFNTKQVSEDNDESNTLNFEPGSSSLSKNEIKESENIIDKFSPFCNVMSQLENMNDNIEDQLLGVNMNSLYQIFESGIPRYPLFYCFRKPEANQNLVEMAKFLDQNCLLNSIQSSQIDHEKLIRSIEDDFLDFPTNLLDWGKSSDPIALYSIISTQKTKLRDDCRKHIK